MNNWWELEIDKCAASIANASNTVEAYKIFKEFIRNNTSTFSYYCSMSNTELEYIKDKKSDFIDYQKRQCGIKIGQEIINNDKVISMKGPYIDMYGERFVYSTLVFKRNK